MTETYASENQITSENGAAAPRWLGTLRLMVFALLGFSILAMVAIGLVAMRLLLNSATPTPTSLSEIYNPAMLPAGANLLSFSTTASGGTLVLYRQNGELSARLYDNEGALVDEAVYP